MAKGGGGALAPEKQAGDVHERLLAVMREARAMLAQTEAQVAQGIGVDEEAVRQMEAGSGDVDTMLRAMEELKVQWAGIGLGKSLPDQLARRRVKHGWSVARMAHLAGLDASEVEALERGTGETRALARLLARLAPAVRRQAPERAFWARSEKEARDSRFTPVELLRPLGEAFGTIDVDPDLRASRYRRTIGPCRSNP